MTEAEERDYIRRLARRLKTDDPLRTLLDPLLRGQPAGDDYLAPAIAEAREPRARRWRQLAVALWALGQTPMQAQHSPLLVAPICKLLDGTEPNDIGDRPARWAMLVGLLAGLPLAIEVLLSLLSLPMGFSPSGAAIILGVIVGLAVGLMCAFMATTLLFLPLLVPPVAASERRHLLPARALAARVLGHWAALEAVGALARAARSRNARLRAEARLALRRTLDALTPDGYGRVSAQDQQCLLSLLGDVDEPLAIAALEALGKVGGGAVAEGVRAVAGEVAHWKDANGSRVIWPRMAALSPAIRETAARVLPRIEERARRERDKGILLRAATAAPDPALLRPAGAAANEPEVLLRSVGEEGEPK